MNLRHPTTSAHMKAPRRSAESAAEVVAVAARKMKLGGRGLGC